MRDELFKVQTMVEDVMFKAEKSAFLLHDLLAEYDFFGNEPSKEDKKKILCDIKKIMVHLNISSDYNESVLDDLHKVYMEIDKFRSNEYADAKENNKVDI